MTYFKTLSVAVLLATVAALSLAKTPAASVTAPAVSKTKSKAMVNRQKLTPSVKKPKKAQASSQPNSKGPGLEAY